MTPPALVVLHLACAKGRSGHTGLSHPVALLPQLLLVVMLLLLLVCL
jgi:uncharacterized membrane protein YtjA (UPF0391 family)